MRIIPIVVKGKVFPLDYVPRIRSEGPPRPPHQARESLERGKDVRRKGRKEGRKGGREEGRKRGEIGKVFFPLPFFPLPSFLPSLVPRRFSISDGEKEVGFLSHREEPNFF